MRKNALAIRERRASDDLGRRTDLEIHLLKVLDGLIFPSTGEVRADYGEILTESARQILEKIGFFAQSFVRRAELVFAGNSDVQLFCSTVFGGDARETRPTADMPGAVKQ